MAPKCNTLLTPTPRRFSTPPTKHTFRKSSAPCFFYARAVDVTLLKAIGTLATQQSKPTETTMEGIVKLLNYVASHPDAELRYHASDMVLWVDSDARYLSESKSRSTCAGYYHFLSNKRLDPSTSSHPYDAEPMHNAPVHVMCNILKEIVSAASEAELPGLFHHGKEECPIRTCLAKLGHPQEPPTPIKTDNTMAAGLANDTVKQNRSKAINMRFYGIRGRVQQGQYHVYWRKAEVNRADYFTKHHATKHHQLMQHEYLHQSNEARSQNYYDALTVDDDDAEITNLNPEVHFANHVQIQSFDPSMVCHSATVPSCEGVLIPALPCNPDLQSRDTGDVTESRLASKVTVASTCRSPSTDPDPDHSDKLIIM